MSNILKFASPAVAVTAWALSVVVLCTVGLSFAFATLYMFASIATSVNPAARPVHMAHLAFSFLTFAAHLVFWVLYYVKAFPEDDEFTIGTFGPLSYTMGPGLICAIAACWCAAARAPTLSAHLAPPCTPRRIAFLGVPLSAAYLVAAGKEGGAPASKKVAPGSSSTTTDA